MDIQRPVKQTHTRWTPIIGLILLFALLLSCDITFAGTTPTGENPPVTTETAPTTQFSSWLQVYFTDPASPTADSYEGGVDQPLVKAIDAAKLSIDVAAYDFNLWSVRNALIHAEQRGVVVRMVMESDNMDEPEVQNLKDAGIPIVGDQRQGLMHDKFMVIDRAQVWTGSLNFTAGGTYKDNNNLICIQSSQVADDYTSEFVEMFSENRFGSDGTANTPYPEVTIDGTPVQIYFSPDDGVAAHIIDLIDNAQESIEFLAYSFTSNDIAEAIIAKSQAGLAVRGVLDQGQSTQDGAEYDHFKQVNLEVRLDGNEKGLMHDKVILIDHQIVITGSYNFTASAEDRNDENLVIIDNESVAFKYLDNFNKVFDEAQPQ